MTKITKSPPLRALLFTLLSLSTSTIIAQQNQCEGGGMLVQFDLSKTNNSKIQNENTYIVILGTNPATKKHAYVSLQDGNHVGTLADITDVKMNGKDYGISLAKLTQNSGGMAQACIPHLTSGRIYLSFGNSLDMPTDKNSLTPQQPDVNNPQTTTGGTLFDKVEFNYSTSGETVINPTGVDFLAIPYTIKQAGHEYGHSGGLNGVVDNMKAIVCKAVGEKQGSDQCNKTWAQSEWSSLVVYDSNKDLMRIDAPGRSGTRFTGYFANYINELSNYYSAAQNRAIKVDLRELKQGMWSGSFEPKSQTLVFSRIDSPSSVTYSYNLTLPQASNSIFMGAQTPFNNRDQIDSTLARDVTSAIVSGMLMRNQSAFGGKDYFDAEGNPVLKNKQQMQELIPFYFNNVDGSVDYTANQCGTSKNAPCVNVYSEAMHALSTDNNIAQPQQSYLNSYAFAYDDFLGMDGTNTQTDAKPATIVLGDMKDRVIPHL